MIEDACQGMLARLGFRSGGLLLRQCSTCAAPNPASSASLRRSPDHVTVTNRVGNQFLSVYVELEGRIFRVRGELVEPFEETLKRIANITEITLGEEKCKEGVAVRLVNGSGPHAGEVKRPRTINAMAFHEGDLLVIGDVEYPIRRNPPCIYSIVMPNYLAVGEEIFPQYVTQHCTDESLMSVEWRRVMEKDGIKHETVVSNSTTYTPTADDVGHRLALVASIKSSRDTPVRVSPSCTVDSPMPMSDMGFVPQARKTPTWNAIDSNQVRIVTYNILDDSYLGSNFSYCDKKALKTSYRDYVLRQELAAYHADVICLQEVGTARFHGSILPYFRRLGYDGELTQKWNVHEGEAILWRTDRFSVREKLYYYLKRDIFDFPPFADIYADMPGRLRSLYQMRNTILQVVHLEDKVSGRDLIVGNTHLYYLPTAAVQRFYSAEAIMRRLKMFQSNAAKWSYSKHTPSIVLCGDFNSKLDSATHEVIKTGQLHPGHYERVDSRRVYDRVIDTGLKLEPTAPHPDIPYTNYTDDFVDVLDNLFFDPETLRLDNVVPVASEESVKQLTALPSLYFPSDHLPIISNLSWVDS